MRPHLFVGTADFTEHFLEHTRPGFLLIDDGPTADAFEDLFPRAKVFDPSQHSFNPLRSIDAKGARDIATILYTAFAGGDGTLTVRNGKRALAKLMRDGTRLDRLRFSTSDPDQEAKGIIDDLLFIPAIERTLCNPTNFSFKGSVIARVDRAELGDDHARALALLLIGQSQGHIIVPDFGFYGCPLHLSLIRQGRLTASARFLAELEPKLRQAALTIPDKVGYGTTYDDAVVLANYVSGFRPDQEGYKTFIEQVMTLPPAPAKLA